MKKRLNIEFFLTLIVIFLCLSIVYVYARERYATAHSGSSDAVNNVSSSGSGNLEPPRFNPHYSEHSNDSVLVNHLKADFVGLYDGHIVRLNVTTLSINSDGFRDRNFSVEKPNNTVRIMALGDSFVFGLGVELNDSYPKQLEILLNKNKGEQNYEVLNFGVPGYNTKQEVEMLKEKGLKYKPDIVILGYLGNDILNANFNYTLIHKTFSKVQTNPDAVNFTRYVEQLLNSYENEINQAYENIGFEEAWQEVAIPLAELRNLSEQMNFSVIILFYDCSNGPFFKEQTQELELLSKNNGWLFINLHDINQREGPAQIQLSKWDGHPTAYANRLYAKYTFEELKEEGIIN